MSKVLSASILSVESFGTSATKPTNTSTLGIENLVSLRYEATGSHIGEPHNGIKPTECRGHWSGAGNFIMDEKTGLIAHWWKDWDKMQMWKQLGWVRPNNDETEFA